MAARVACTLAVEENRNSAFFGNVLMIQEYGKWNFVTEHAEDVDRETYKEAAVRGFMEETGLKVELTGYLGAVDTVYQNKVGEDEMATIMIFAARILRGERGKSDDTTESVKYRAIKDIEGISESDLRFPKLVQFAIQRLKNGKIRPLDEVEEIPHI
ncbi:NUDIX domain-containing protein [Candidatus Saccharibacteria bacterium]|nr:NUDIX domain-containing protein [Candidatus Saccharibacteria bacterium]